MTRT